MDRKLLQTFAPKLGITCEKILRKSEELMRLYESKSQCSGLQLNGNCKVVILLDLAANASGQPVEKKEAIRLSGATKAVYTNSYKSLECLLGLQTKHSVADLCVQFGCSEAKQLAIDIWRSYCDNLERRTGDIESVNTQRPLFTGAAVLAACKKLRVKVDRTKLLEMGGVKRAVSEKLLAEMETVASSIQCENDKEKVSQRKRPKTLMDRLEDITNETDVKTNSSFDAEDDNETETRPAYEEWKRKILEKASLAIAKK